MSGDRVILVYRDAITGMFVTRAYADANPRTTIAHQYEVAHTRHSDREST